MVIEQDTDPNIGRDSFRLLERAARLEKVDLNAAVAAYEEITRLYPDTPASREATRNIQTINVGHPTHT